MYFDTAFQRHDEVREAHILLRHEKRRAEWEAFRHRMAKRLNKDIDDLVFSRSDRSSFSARTQPEHSDSRPNKRRADEFRMIIEQRDLLGKAIPIEERLGKNLWQVRLLRRATQHPSPTLTRLLHIQLSGEDLAEEFRRDG
jgi:hypothetical protein